MKKSGFSELIRQSEATLCFIFCLMMAVVFPFFLSNGYMKGGTDKGVLYIYISGAFCIFGVFLYVLYIIGRVKDNGLSTSFAKPSLPDIFMLVYFLVINLSFYFSYNRRFALTGEGGWYQGYLTSIFLVLSYFFISQFLDKYKLIVIFLCISAGIEFLLGTLNRFDIYPVELEGASTGFISTLGNINWFCGFWSVFFALAAGIFYMTENRIVMILTGILTGLGAIIGAIQGSDSALIVYAAVILAIFFKAVKSDKEHRLRSMITASVIVGSMSLMHVFLKITGLKTNYDSVATSVLAYSPISIVLFVIAVAIGVVTYLLSEEATETLFKVLKNISLLLLISGVVFYLFLLIVRSVNPEAFAFIPNESPFIPGYEWGNGRGYTWVAGIKVYFDGGILQKLIGWGPDSFAYGVYRGDSSVASFIIDKFGDARLTNAHNEWITVLCNYGLVGFIGFVGAQTGKAKQFLSRKGTIPFACGVALVSYMSHNFFSFAQPVNIPFIFIIMGIGNAAMQNKDASKVDF